MVCLRRFDWTASLIVAIALAMPAAVAWLAMPAPVTTSSLHQLPAPPTAQVLRATRELKLITVSIESTVSTTKTDESWRGTAKATVQAPVKYHFGVDLSKIDDRNLSYNPLTQIQTLTIPPPGL